VASVVLPIVPAGVSHALRAAKYANKAINAVDTAADTIKAVDKVADTAKAIDNAADAGKAVNNLADATKTADGIGGEYIRAVRTDWVGKSQAFKTDKLEDGLSVFKGVSPDDVLKEMPGKNVPNTTVIIPGQGLPLGTQVIKKPARGLSQYLSDAHYILVRPEGWSIDRFAKTLKKLVGWD
jgi:hypothetical protein